MVSPDLVIDPFYDSIGAFLVLVICSSRDLYMELTKAACKATPLQLRTAMTEVVISHAASIIFHLSLAPGLFSDGIC